MEQLEYLRQAFGQIFLPYIITNHQAAEHPHFLNGGINFRHQGQLLPQGLEKQRVAVPGGKGVQHVAREGKHPILVQVEGQVHLGLSALAVHDEVAALVPHAEAQGHRLAEGRLVGVVFQFAQGLAQGGFHAVGKIARHAQAGVLRLKNHALPAADGGGGHIRNALGGAHKGEGARGGFAVAAGCFLLKVAFLLLQLAQHHLLFRVDLCLRPGHVGKKAQEQRHHLIKKAGMGLEAEHHALRIGGPVQLRAEAGHQPVQPLGVQIPQPPEAQMLQQMAHALVLPVFIQGAALEIQAELDGMQMRLTAAQKGHSIGQTVFVHGGHGASSSAASFFLII